MSRFSSKAKRGARTYRRTYRRFGATYRFGLWCVLWAAAFVFTQALRSSASTVFFVFVSFIPPVCAVYALLADHAVKIYIPSDDVREIGKGEAFDYEFRILNESPLPYPFTEAILCVPLRDSVRTGERTARLSLMPNGAYTVKNTVRFRFRGAYEIGVRCIYVYDPLRLWRVRVDADAFCTAEVMPRVRVAATNSAESSADTSARSLLSQSAYDKTEISDVREYRTGDAQKSIHWKLSLKSEIPVVREYNSGAADVSYVFCDVGAHFPTRRPLVFYESEAARARAAVPHEELGRDEFYYDMNEYTVDSAVEESLAAVARELRDGRRVVLAWYDERAALGIVARELTSLEDINAVLRDFATAPIAEKGKKLSDLSRFVCDTGESKRIYVIPSLDDETIADVALGESLGGASGGATVIAVCAPQRYADPEARRRYESGCVSRFAERGIALVMRAADEDGAYCATKGREDASEVKNG